MWVLLLKLLQAGVNHAVKASLIAHIEGDHALIDDVLNCPPEYFCIQTLAFPVSEKKYMFA